MKVCPEQGKPSARRRAVLLSCGLVAVVLALPVSAWLDRAPERSRPADPSFRTGQSLQTASFSAPHDVDSAPVASAGTDPSTAARSESTPRFQSRSKPFNPLAPKAGKAVPAPLPIRDVVDSSLAVASPRRQLSLDVQAESQGALDELESTYQLALASFGSQVGAGRSRPGVNPFQQALESGESPPTGIPGPAAGGPSGGPTASDSDNAGNPGSGESTPPVDQPVPDTPPDGGAFEEPLTLSYLVTGAPRGASVQRAGARDDGVFVLEDDNELQLFGGATFGFARPTLLFGERDQMLTADINGDGLLDIVRTHEQFLGAVVEILVRSGAGYEFAASNIFRFDSIVGVALYDWDADGTRELAVVTQARDNLLFFEIGPEGLIYEREVTLRFKPAALIGTMSSTGEQRLYLVPSNLKNRSARYMTSYAGTAQLPWRIRGLKSYQLEGRGAPEIVTLLQDNRLVLLRRDGSSLRMSGSLETTHGAPLSLMGPHSKPDTWELMYLP